MFLASSCSYPKLAPQPMRPDSLLTGPLEPTSQSYAVAKLAGIQMCEAYRLQHGVEFFAAIPADVSDRATTSARRTRTSWPA